MNPADNIEDRSEYRSEREERDAAWADHEWDLKKDREAEAHFAQHPAPVMRANGPCARAVARAKARMEGDPSEEMFNGCDSMWQVPA